MSPRTEQVSIYLRYISGGLTKETFIGGTGLRPSKTGAAIVHYYFFSLAGPRDKQVVFAIRAKLGLTPQMDVRPYAVIEFALACNRQAFLSLGLLAMHTTTAIMAAADWAKTVKIKATNQNGDNES